MSFYFGATVVGIVSTKSKLTIMTLRQLTSVELRNRPRQLFFVFISIQ